MPIQILPAAPRKPSLGELLGGGIGRGLETGLTRRAEEKGRLQQALALQEAKETARAEQPLTPYQQLLTQQREREVGARVGNYTKSILGEQIKFGTVTPIDKAKIDKTALNLVRQGMELPDATSQAILENTLHKDFLETIDLPKKPYTKAGRESAKKKIVNTLEENNITDILDIQQLMKDKKWTGKDLQDVYRQIKTPKKPTIAEKELKPEVEKKPEVEEKPELEKMPPASQHTGKIIRETVTGKRYRSNGKNWILVK